MRRKNVQNELPSTKGVRVLGNPLAKIIFKTTTNVTCLITEKVDGGSRGRFR